MPNDPTTGIVLQEDLPIYPHLIQLLRVTGTQVPGPAGVAQTAGSSVLSSTLYVAFTQQMRTDGLLPRDREPCLVDDVNSGGITGIGGLGPGYYIGRLAGSHNGLPVYEVATGITSDNEASTSSFFRVVSTTPIAGFYDVLWFIRDNTTGQFKSTGQSAWMYVPNQASLVTGGYYPGTMTAEMVAGRRVFATQGSFTGHVQCKSATTDVVSGMYDGFFVRYDGVGGLVVTDTAIWIKEGNSAGRLILNDYYFGAVTGFNFGRWVYTVIDFNLTVLYENLLGSQSQVLYLELGPTNTWDITAPLAGSRRALVKRILSIYEETTLKVTYCWRADFSPASAWDVTQTAEGHATIERLLNVREGTTTRTTHTWQVDFDSTDFNVAATATGHATVNTEGGTESFDILTNCVAGVLKVKCITFTRGLLKSVGAERDLGTGSCP